MNNIMFLYRCFPLNFRKIFQKTFSAENLPVTTSTK